LISLPFFRIVIDTREQNPYNFSGAIRKTLKTGDYSVEGLEDVFAIERKSREDLWGSLGQGHDRFRREMERAKCFNEFVIIIESNPYAIMMTAENGCRLNPNSIRGSMEKWREEFGVRWVFGDTRENSQRYVHWKLRRWYDEYVNGIWVTTDEYKKLTKEVKAA